MKPETRIRKRQAKLHYARAQGVSAYVPPAAQVRAAQERTEGMVAYFEMASARADREQYSRMLQELARSCYLQGARDVAEVAARMQNGERFDGI